MNKEIRKIILPAQDPEQLIFQRRKDGYYDVTAKVYAINPDNNSKATTVYEKAIVKLPDWIYGIPFEVVKQDNGDLYSIICPEENVAERGARG